MTEKIQGHMGIAQLDGNAIALNTGVRTDGTQRVTIATNDVVPTSQSGDWTVNVQVAVDPLPVQGTVSALLSCSVQEDQASTNSHQGIAAMAVRRATPADSSGTDGDFEPLQVSAGRLWASAVITSLPTVVGATPFTLIAAGVTEDKTVIKASAGRLLSLGISNVNAAPCFVKFYDKATAPDVSTDTPIATFLCPGSTAGGVRDVKLPEEGIAFALGISFVIVTLVAITNATEVAETEVVVNGSYK